MLRIPRAAYFLLKDARLSVVAVGAIGQATQDTLTGAWEIVCSPRTTRELWKWFDDCEHYAALLPREVWKVGTCRRAKAWIERANDSDSEDQRR